MKKKQLYIGITIAIFFIMAMPMLAMAQIDNVPGDPDVPIDGGLSLLVAAGVGYGVRKVKQRRTQGQKQ
jgi:hypothetical protein